MSPPSRPAPDPRELIVQLESMTYGGAALGRADGKAIFVTGGLPSEVVRAAIEEERARYARARVVEVLQPSPDRITPPCPHFGFTSEACGGCQWQHIAYEAQLRFKTAIVREQLQRLGRLAQPPVRDIIPSPAIWHYRNHAQFHFTPAGQPGFQTARSQRVIPVADCLIIEPPLRAWLRAQPPIASAARPRLGVRCASPDRVGGALEFQIKDVTLRVSAASFFQVNTALLETLIDHVLAWAAVRADDTVLDAYCGVGLFTRFLAPHATRVIGIEANASAVEDWRANLASCPNAQLQPGLVEDVLPAITAPLSVAVLDPPRAGCGPRVIAAVIAQQIERVVYVSCDPATLARDVRQLVAGGYALIAAQPIDLFPHSYHIETIVLLQRAVQAIL